jgi:inosine-uridine nucleoside N-ribohydrolase
MTMMPLDATIRVQLEAEHRAQLAACGTPLTDALCGMLALGPATTPTLHDPLAIGMAIDPRCAAWRSCARGLR